MIGCFQNNRLLSVWLLILLLSVLPFNNHGYNYTCFLNYLGHFSCQRKIKFLFCFLRNETIEFSGDISMYILVSKEKQIILSCESHVKKKRKMWVMNFFLELSFSHTAFISFVFAAFMACVQPSPNTTSPVNDWISMWMSLFCSSCL